MKQKQKSELSDESDKEFEEEGSDEDEQEFINEQKAKKIKESKADNHINQKDYSSDENMISNRILQLQDRTDGQFQFQRMKPII